KTVKPWPADIDEWTHWLHGPDGNAVARDERAGPPRRFRWVAAPLWSRSHDSVPSVSAIVSAKGRLFTIVDEAPVSMDGSAPDKWSLVARDAFNGIELWRIAIPEWGWRTWARRFTCRFTVPTHMPRRLVAVGDRVYATLGFNAPLTELDAATGKVLRTFPGTQFTDEILCAEGLLVIAINQAAQEPGPKRGESPPPVPKWVAAIDRRSGTIRWKTGDYVGLRSKTGPMERITHLSMAAGGGRVFFVNGEKIISLNLKDGTQAWRVPRPEVPEHKMRYDIRITDMCSLLYSDGIVLFAQLNPDRKIDWREIRGRVHAFSADTGKEIWNRQCASWGWAHPADVFVLRGLVWVTDFKNDFVLGLDPKTGEVRQKVSDHKAFDNAHHHRCYRNKATVRYMMTSFRGLEFIDWDSGRTDLHHWVRGTCRLGAIPCNGMVYATPHPCDCYITSKLNGLLALEPAAACGQAGQGGREDHPLVKGPAYGQIGNRKPEIGNRVSEISNLKSEISDNDWPTYRHDARRSGAAAGAVAMPLKTTWQRDLGGALTGPVVADGRLFVARKAGRDVVCLDAASGGEQWRYTAGGKLDTPPTVDGGRVVFGSADGWVTCLRATDGLLMWRFRAAPRERLVAAFGGLESAWPVHGSVLVQDGTVYCTAGRSSFLDGGIYAFALRLDSGEVLARERLRSDHAMQVDWGRDQTVDTGVLSDLLVAHEGGIYLRQRPLFGKGRSTRFPTYLRASGGLLDTNWFHRTRWFLRAVPMAEYLVFNDERVCGVRARKRIGGYGGHFAPGAKGYELFAADKRAVTPPKPEPARLAARPKTTRGSTGRPAGASSTPKVRTPKDRWCIRVPVRVTAMLLAGNLLVAAGTPDVICAEDPWAAYEGRKGGRLLVVSADDGTVQGDMRLAAPPVLDGLAAARGRLYLATIDGCVLCLGQTK
ncbi:MAG: PQQ-binding-like beta-propeller repeat protein, partial [Planctomycetota bacterium]|nr:PQQ-binding-like beta-propeller repeat protein [Planctomycetota bacterium]